MQSELTAALGSELQPLGFRRRRANWCRAGVVLYAVVHVQKSAWDEHCYLNLGFAPADQAPGGRLAENRCPIRFRFEALRSTRPEDLRLLGPAAVDAPGTAAWTTAVTERVVRPVASLLAEVHDLPGLGDALRARVSNRIFVHHDLRDALAHHPPLPRRPD